MRISVLATDYDGTLATHGAVEDSTLRALERFVATGRKLVLVTGRRLEDLFRVFPRVDLFACIVGENGAVLYTPSTEGLRVLAEPPPPAFAQTLVDRGVSPVSTGHVIVATYEPHHTVVLETIREMGLELVVEFNKGAVMVLPAGITKRTGLEAALEDLRIPARQVVGVGDAENDHSFLAMCGCAVSVANAIPSLRARSDWVTPASHGAGVAQLVDRILAGDLPCRAVQTASR